MAGPAAALAVAMAAGACGGGGEPRSDRVIPLPTETPTTSTVPSTTTTVPSFGFDHDTVQKVWADYQAAVDVLDSLIAAPNPDDPRLAIALTGPMLEHWRTKLGRRRDAGERSVYPPDSRHRQELKGIQLLSGETAEIEICGLDDAVVRGPGGAVVNDEVAILRAIVTLRLEGGRWKWAELNGHDALEAECPGFFE